MNAFALCLCLYPYDDGDFKKWDAALETVCIAFKSSNSV